MMSKPIEQIATLTIGTVESVSPSEIRVLLEPNAPQTTALNTGVPTGFPRINGYVLIPNETGALVGLVVWLGVERSQFPKRTGLKDFGLVDLPFPLRKISLTPLGTLIIRKNNETGETAYHLERGVSAFPSVGDVAQLPTAAQLRSIIEASSDEDRRVRIGTSPLAANAEVTVDPDKIFGRHLAVLGNTGSGKSCSVAGLIRWSLAHASTARSDSCRPNARFIILDPNGEYSPAFSDYKDVRRFRVSPKKEENIEPLLVPVWMWNSQEWSAFAHAAPGVQRPLLLQALRDMRSGARLSEPAERQAARLMRSYKAIFEGRIAQGASGYQGFPENKNCGNQVKNLATDTQTHAENTQRQFSQALQEVALFAEQLASRRHWKSANSEGYNDFSETELREVIIVIDNVLTQLPGQPDERRISEDAPIEFPIATFPDHLDQRASETPGGQTAQFISTLTMRIRMMIADRRLGPVVNPGEQVISFDQWLESYIGKDRAENGELAIVDLSLVPSDVIHIVIAVVARIVFEATQRYRKLNERELPTVLVLEEAHTFIKRGSDEESSTPTPFQMCRQTFERIAREGRKFGLGLVLSSQRPSELSPTVLAQCNT
ncbi:MAG: ATP-binding protein [Desulfobacteraceae bacterium]|nr:MAG: ATP-binding protein [Desulfobacteraceae bacterium]